MANSVDGDIAIGSNDSAAPYAFPVSESAAAELGRVETRLREVASNCDRSIADKVLHLIEAGGKRMRATLVVSAAMAVRKRQGVSERVIDAGVAVELLHLASLYHDDVLDSAPYRRDRPTANALWGEHAAVLTGDLLLAQAYGVAARLGSDELRRLSETVTKVCAGQIAETTSKFDAARQLADYDASVRGKTAAFVSTSCWLGAMTAGASMQHAGALACYGLELGMAFQVIDDVLDLYATPDMVGKPVGGDLRTGVFTLPILLALRVDPSMRDLLTTNIDEESAREVCSRVREVGADRDAVGVALAHLGSAVSHLHARGFAPEGKRLLVSIANALRAPLQLLGFSVDPETDEQSFFEPAPAIS